MMCILISFIYKEIAKTIPSKPNSHVKCHTGTFINSQLLSVGTEKITKK